MSFMSGDDENCNYHDDDDDDDDDDTFHHQCSLPVLIVLIGPGCWEAVLADLCLVMVVVIATWMIMICP